MLTLRQALANFTVDQLKQFSSLLPDATLVGRKDELVAAVMQQYQSLGLSSLWRRLDELEQAAVAESLYSISGYFDAHKFHAKYGRSAAFSVKAERRDRPSLLSLFLFHEEGGRCVPLDLRDPLKAFVGAPKPASLKTVETLPETSDASSFVVRGMESEALGDLPRVLRLIEQGKVKVSDKSRLPGAATTQFLASQLSNGDFYVEPPKKNAWDQEIGAIKAFAWPMLLQAGGLTQQDGAKLALSRAGLKALSAPPAEVLRGLWNKWLKNTLLDEFNRVDVIKGQKGKGRVMAAITPRRAAIDEALGHCPVGDWIKVDELGRFMRAEDLDFSVCHDPWRLYIGDAHYGALGYQGFHDWEILQLRYLLAVLFEYAAPLGMIDVAYIDPEDARKDFRGLWGIDDLRFLSRYDGLAYIRLTELGAYCLGLRDTYTPCRPPSTLRLSILPSLHIRATDGQPVMEESTLLETWAIRETETVWRLDRTRAVAAVEQGHDIALLHHFLIAGEDQPLPDSVEAFIKAVAQQGGALKTAASALLLECASADIARQIAEHKETAKLCLPAGPRHLAVRTDQAEKFRAALHILGFGWKI
jgi:hypothetical protein